jgi:hypothetical protein
LLVGGKAGKSVRRGFARIKADQGSSAPSAFIRFDPRQKGLCMPFWQQAYRAHRRIDAAWKEVHGALEEFVVAGHRRVCCWLVEKRERASDADLRG